ncbi:MAG: hypothetical protein ACTHMS_24335 [Jatrophihabitans sp.]|uniref:hypothetical protein n=1 Tax=Jatrophihabitans sp. TaxID=1932789 RepID=UPI003F81ED0B
MRPVVDAPPGWLPQVNERVLELLLASDIALHPDSVGALLNLLQDSIWSGTPAPFVSPVEAGGVSAEFRTPRVELHIEFDAGGVGTAYALNRDGAEWDGPLGDLPDGIEKWAWRLAHGAN